jgi:glycosyltransferase involved in cell wall biosynthesis
LRILLVTDAFPPVCGGSGWSTYELARGLARRGHEVRLVQPRPGQPQGTSERSYEGLRVTEIGSWAPPVPFLRTYVKNERLHARLARELADLARRHRIDVLHGQHVLSAPAAVMAGQLSARPVVCTVRDYWPLCYWSNLIHDPRADHLCPACTRPMMARCLRPRSRAWPLALPAIPYMHANLRRKRLALAHASVVIAVSSTIAHDLRQRAPELEATRLETIPNPVDVEAIRATAARLAAPGDGAYAVFAGKLELNKGVRHLVPAVTAAQLQMPVVVLGDGSLRGEVEAAARQQSADVRVLGWRPRDEVLAWLAHARFVIFPSHGPESLSRVLLEAGALGVPAAAMDTGGTRDIVVPAVTGLLAASPEDLARDIARLAGDEALRTRLGTAVRAHVDAHFAAATVVDRLVAIYDELARAEDAPDA